MEAITASLQLRLRSHYMNASAFAEKLMAIAPTVEKLTLQGFSPEDVIGLRSQYIPMRKNNTTTYTDPLLQLVSLYECQNVCVGMIRFDAEVIDWGVAWKVGKDEADPLLVSKENGRVYV